MSKNNLKDMFKELDSLLKEEKQKLPVVNNEQKEKSHVVEDYADFFGGSTNQNSPNRSSSTANQNYVTQEDLQKNYTEFIARIQTQLASLGGGGSYELMDNRDVVYKKNSSIENDSFLAFNSAINKFEARKLPSDLVEIKQITESTTITTSGSAEQFIGVDCSAPCSITLDGSFLDGQKIITKDKSGLASTNPITISSSDLIDGESFISISINWGSITLIRNNNTWSII